MDKEIAAGIALLGPENVDGWQRQDR